MTASTSTGTLRGGSVIKKVPSVYTEEQIQQYLTRIGYSKSQEKDVLQNHKTSLDDLSSLMRHHLVAFPFENTAMHYTKTHEMDVSPQGLFDRLVKQGMGSYCYGQNSLFLGMIRGLGYRAYTGHARVNGARNFAGDLTPDYGSLGHLVILVQPVEGSNQTYVVDVGFGSPGLSRPILLAEGVPSPGAMGPEMHVLTKHPHPQSSIEQDFDSTQLHTLWRLEMYHEGSNPRVHQIMYTFSEQESFQIDFDHGSFVTSQKPGIIFWGNVMCCRYIRLAGDAYNPDSRQTDEKSAQDGDPFTNDDDLVRYTLFNDQVKRNAGPESTVLRELKTDLERVRALREVFGLDIPDESVKYIVGRVPAF